MTKLEKQSALDHVRPFNEGADILHAYAQADWELAQDIMHAKPTQLDPTEKRALMFARNLLMQDNLRDQYAEGAEKTAAAHNEIEDYLSNLHSQESVRSRIG